MIAQKTPHRSNAKRGAQQLLPLSCLLASLPVLAAEQPKELPQASETMVVTGTAMKVEVPMAETPRAVSVVNREDLDQHAVQQLDESCATAPACSAASMAPTTIPTGSRCVASMPPPIWTATACSAPVTMSGRRSRSAWRAWKS